MTSPNQYPTVHLATRDHPFKTSANSWLLFRFGTSYSFLADQGREIKCTVQCSASMAHRPVQSRQLLLRAYYPNIYTENVFVVN